jgi:hypothetical protein
MGRGAWERVCLRIDGRIALLCLAGVSCGHVTEKGGDSGGQSGASAGVSLSGSASTPGGAAGSPSSELAASGRAGAANEAGYDAGGAAGSAMCPADAGACTPQGSGGSQHCSITMPGEDEFLTGVNLDSREGQRVVSPFGEAIVTNGAFRLYVGRPGTCHEFHYRFDKDGDGKCSTGDEVYRYVANLSPGADPSMTEGSLGDVASCDDLADGQDLAFSWGCFQPCGHLRIQLFTAGQLVSGADTIINLANDGAFVGKGFAALLHAGEDYELRYFRTEACAETHALTFQAKPGRNVVTLDPALDSPAPSACQ